ncbi:hypothetical protein [Paraburkholderia fungorum]|uniref:hypothetical protein n=1 Tax=Paraburkholderia fungorum TaxID=134537 RepID=UPI0038BB4C0D
MTGMFEAYPVDEAARCPGSGLVPLPRMFPRTPSITRCARYLAALAADASEHGGRIICHEVDFRSKPAERQLAKVTSLKEIFLSNGNFEHIRIATGELVLYLYFCVRLRFSIRH